MLTGEDTLFDGQHCFDLTRIDDGTSYTLLVTESAQAVPWTKPEDMPYRANKPLPKLGGPGGFGVVFCDGHVDSFRELDDKTLRALITPAGND